MAFNPKDQEDKYKKFSYEFVMSPCAGVSSCFIILCEDDPLLVPIASLEHVQIIVNWLNEVNKYKELEAKDNGEDYNE
jgi:hypothetical protein